MSDISSPLQTALADRYRLERVLGVGGMATVYLTEDLKHHRRVAVKVLRPDVSMALGAERFRREIETTANLRHPHILPLYDSGEAADALFYVMPYIEGESLKDRLDRDKQLPIDNALQITRAVADALPYAHMMVSMRILARQCAFRVTSTGSLIATAPGRSERGEDHQRTIAVLVGQTNARVIAAD